LGGGGHTAWSVTWLLAAVSCRRLADTLDEGAPFAAVDDLLVREDADAVVKGFDEFVGLVHGGVDFEVGEVVVGDLGTVVEEAGGDGEEVDGPLVGGVLVEVLEVGGDLAGGADAEVDVLLVEACGRDVTEGTREDANGVALVDVGLIVEVRLGVLGGGGHVSTPEGKGIL
jgi:hypothetical protein